MITRRGFIEIAAATAAVTGLGARLGRAAAAGAISQDDLLRFTPAGQLTILHMSDCHAQLEPIYCREPSHNLGVGAARGRAPHLTGEAFLKAFGIAPHSPEAYMLTSADYQALARTYGRVGGMDRIATLVKAIRAERGADRVLLLDGGDLLQGSYTSLKTKGADMIAVAQALGVAATTGHWEFTLGEKRIEELFGNIERPGSSGIPFLAGNVRDTDFAEPVFHATHMFERGGLRVGVVGQAFPYTPIANPRWMIPRWSFGIRESDVRKSVAAMRREGADIVLLLSHNGFDVDRKLAERVEGIDVILTAHTHDAVPAPVRVGRTLLIASGSHGKFLSRLDLEVKNRAVTGFAYRLVPVLSDAITPDADMAKLIADVRAPHAGMLKTELARTEGLLYRRDTFSGTFDDVICDALLTGREAEIAFSPGFRWGTSLPAGHPVTWEDVYNATAITYPAAYRVTMSGAMIKTVLEDVADNLFNPDPYYQQGGDMVRTGGLGFAIDVDAPAGRRISGLHLSKSGAALEPGKDYVVAGWGSINENTEGPPVWDLLAAYLKDRKVVTARAPENVKFSRAAN
jgi:sulfur-oxidizing protein SoxB